MTLIVVLDTGVLGMVTNPKASPETNACKNWFRSLLAAGASARLPEIADYELRRELLRANKTNGLRRLDALKAVIGYEPLTTAAMLRAAECWAQARQRGIPTADAAALDGDMILAAQILLLARPNNEPIVVATTNVRHLETFVDARLWSDIQP